ncbi:putative pentatricopeptide repeat protein [Diaporthe ampelina]|uniref:Putative pentatricopeptide repeat protein n=1 Tax=Diaporthe ampelina TaxID=1214573 RepID=A0A0G2FMH4_9PEZI|nr:putative pentatricopeptide repeat protein [Diaporthe ampelina]
MSATKDLSLDIWRDLCETKSMDINTPLGASVCTSLLAFKDDDLHALDENSATPAELFQCLLDLGLIPNVITYTTIIHSLCVKKELETAIEVFEVMKQHGVQPDEYTYSVIMNGCKSCGDFESMLRFAFEARAAGSQDPVVWNDIIHATFLACLKEPRQPGGVRRARCIVWGRFDDVRDFMEMQGFIPRREAGSREESALDAILSNVGDFPGGARPPIRHPRPSVHTWSILIKAFMSNRRNNEAEHILKLMQVHGVKPNIVTWNTLAAEYARLGNTKQAVEAMRRLEAAGFKSDEWTMRAFSYISDKAKAIRLMEQKVEENKITKAAIEKMEQQQPQGDESDIDEMTNLEDELEGKDLSARQEQGRETHEEVPRWSPGDETPIPEAKSEVEDSRRPAEEMRPVSREATGTSRQEVQKPVAKAPAPSKPDLGAWDDLLWDQAAEPEPEGQDKREESVA